MGADFMGTAFCKQGVDFVNGRFVSKCAFFAKIKMTIHTDGRFYFHLEL